jgi:hypothetical protein
MDLRSASFLKTGTFALLTFCSILLATSGPELITNGDFSSATTTDWTLQAGTAVTGAVESGQYVITRSSKATTDTSSYSIQFSYKGLNIEKGKTYVLSFAAKADSAFSSTVNVGMNKSPWGTYSGYNQFTITTVLDTFAFEFKMDSATDNGSRLAIDVGYMKGPGKCYLDNISLKSRTDSGTTTDEIIKNGDFSSSSITMWKLNIRSGSGAVATMKVVGGELEVTVVSMGTSSPTNYDIQVSQVGLSLLKGKTYNVTWDARSDSTYQMSCYVGMNKDPWAAYSSYTTLYMTKEKGSGSYTFIMDSANDAGARIALDVGDPNGGGARKVYFDNISVKCSDCISNVIESASRFPALPRVQAMVKDRKLVIAGVSSPVAIRLYNAAGKEVLAHGVVAPNNGTVSFSLNRPLANGVYFANIEEKATPKELSSTMVRCINR